MTKAEFVLAIGLLVLIGYLVLPPKVRELVWEEVEQYVQSSRNRAELAGFERAARNSGEFSEGHYGDFPQHHAPGRRS